MLANDQPTQRMLFRPHGTRRFLRVLRAIAITSLYGFSGAALAVLIAILSLRNAPQSMWPVALLLAYGLFAFACLVGAVIAAIVDMRDTVHAAVPSLTGDTCPACGYEGEGEQPAQARHFAPPQLEIPLPTSTRAGAQRSPGTQPVGHIIPLRRESIIAASHASPARPASLSPIPPPAVQGFPSHKVSAAKPVVQGPILAPAPDVRYTPSQKEPVTKKASSSGPIWLAPQRPSPVAEPPSNVQVRTTHVSVTGKTPRLETDVRSTFTDRLGDAALRKCQHGKFYGDCYICDPDAYVSKNGSWADD